MNDLIDALVALVEPTPAASLNIDTSCAAPIDPQGYFNTDTTDKTASLYAYPTADAHNLSGASPCDREDFTVTLLYVVDDRGEIDNMLRDRAVSDLLDGKAHDYLDVIRHNRNVGPWQHIQGALDYDEVLRLDVRGIAVRVSGYRFVPGCE